LVWASPKNGRKITSTDFKLDTYWKKEKRETRKKMEGRCTQSYERTWSPRWRRRTDFIGDWMSQDVAIHHRTTTYIQRSTWEVILAVLFNIIGYLILVIK
jgi:thymidylate synthase